MKKKDILLISLLIIFSFYFFIKEKEKKQFSKPVKNLKHITNTPLWDIWVTFKKKIENKQDKINTLESIKLWWEWFLNNQNEDFLYYKYDIKKKRYNNSKHYLRSMGALWSIVKLSNFLEDTRFLELWKKWINYFENYFIYDEKNNFYYINITPKKIKLWYSAFIILSLLEIDYPNKEKYLKWFANWIIYNQTKSWKLKTHFFSYIDTGVDYYPWEALFALMKLYDYTKNTNYLDTVKKAFPYYKRYFKSYPHTAFIPWQTRAYYELYKIEKDKEIADFIFDMNDYMLKINTPSKECKNFIFQRGITTAVFTEWMIQAYKLAKDLNDTKRMYCYKNFITEASSFIKSLQIIQTEDKKALWWFKWNNSSNILKVDRNQHAIMALIEALEEKIIK